MMGDDKFQKGIIKYIKDYQYGTASLNDFLTAMDATGNDTCFRILPMTNWQLDSLKLLIKIIRYVVIVCTSKVCLAS